MAVSAAALVMAALDGVSLIEDGDDDVGTGVSVGVVAVAAVSGVTVTVTVVVKAPAVWHCDMAVYRVEVHSSRG